MGQPLVGKRENTMECKMPCAEKQHSSLIAGHPMMGAPKSKQVPTEVQRRWPTKGNRQNNPNKEDKPKHCSNPPHDQCRFQH
ncbi:hypothetical protein I309_02431 [Cryptococcus deuterogattii LA55]|nr:hypothetical protein I309_02431 [Cryptococcus deuterogattii LA55]KIR93525.1 hypothetical protein I304_02197 [Cryptococcus deuterogattii CBS 10090]